MQSKGPEAELALNTTTPGTYMLNVVLKYCHKVFEILTKGGHLL